MKKTYSVYGWDNMENMAVLCKQDYKTHGGALRAYNHYKTTEKYVMLVVREEIDYLCGVETSTPIHKWKK